MVIYDLICDNFDQFEGWFKNLDDYETQLERGLLSCPLCGSEHVKKVPNRTNIAKIHKNSNQQRPQEYALNTSNQKEFLRQVRKFVEANFEDVGSRFADEARKIHFGESEDRNIKGEARSEEIQELIEDGIEAFPLPPNPEKLN